MTQYFQTHEKNSRCLKPPSLRQPCSSPHAFCCGSWKDTQSEYFRLRGGKRLPMTLGTFGEPQATAAWCRAVPRQSRSLRGCSQLPQAATCNCSVTSRAHLHLVQPWKVNTATWDFPGSISICLLYACRQEGEGLNIPAHTAGAALSSVPIAAPARGRSAVHSDPRL